MSHVQEWDPERIYREKVKTPLTFREVVQQQADRFGEKVYLFFQDEEVSYRALHERSNQIAHLLISAGVRHQDKVGIFSTNCPEFIYTVLACAKIGAVCVPVNPMMKAEEAHYICENSDMRALIASSKFSHIVEGNRKTLPALRDVWYIGQVEGRKNVLTEMQKQPTTTPQANVSLNDVMVIIYTSGTTGKPKGVELTHACHYHSCSMSVGHRNLKPEDRFLNFMPLFHVVGQTATTFCSLVAGASLVLLDGFSAKTYLPTVLKFRPTILNVVPTILGILNLDPDYAKYDLSFLRYIGVGTAPLAVEQHNEFVRKYKANKLNEGYGLSECTCYVTGNPIDGRVRKIGSIGLPLPGITVKIMDNNDVEMAVGQIGEICVRAPSVMKGYYKNETATKDTLKNGWLHTGDLGSQDSDGYFYITGRKKEMIIRGGENIYPKEVEEVLYRHPAVAECAVVGIPDKIWGEQVAAALVLREGHKFSAEEVMKYCKEHIADYKCPRIVKFFAEFPKNATGKIHKLTIKDIIVKGMQPAAKL